MIFKKLLVRGNLDSMFDWFISTLNTLWPHEVNCYLTLVNYPSGTQRAETDINL